MCREERDRHLLVQRVNIDLIDACVLLRRVLRRNPRGVTIEEQYHVSILAAVVSSETKALRSRMRRGEAKIATPGVVYSQARDKVCESYQLHWTTSVSSRVTRNNERPLAIYQSFCHLQCSWYKVS